MSRLLRTGLAVVGVLSAATAGAAELTNEKTPTRRESPRSLNGHVFQPSQLVPGPFSVTSFGMATFFGGGEVEAPRYDRQANQIGTRKYPMSLFGQSLGFDVRLTPDIALRLGAQGLLFTGTDARAMLVVGGSAQFGLQVGVVAGRNLGANTRLSFVVDAGPEPQVSVTIANAVIRAIENNSFEEGGLFSTVNLVRVAPGVSFAWAPSAAVGFTTEARFIYSRSVTDEDTERTGQGFALGATAELDLDPLTHWPIAIQGSYRGEFPVESGTLARVDQAGAGFFYTRRVRLALGLELLWRHGEIRPTAVAPLDADSGTALIRVQYYW